jgi:hypothetical protein
MKFDESDLRAGYTFLRQVAFHNDSSLPPAKAVRFIVRKLKHYGYHDFVRGKHTIWVDRATKSWTHVLQILAHEMAHLARRDHVYNTDEEAHDTLFQQTARAIEIEMGWPRGSV